MAKKEKGNTEFTYNFAIVKIEIVGFELLPPPENGIDFDKLIHEVGFDHSLDMEEELFSVAPFVRILTPEKQIISRLMIACAFRIPGLKKQLANKQDSNEIPVQIIEIFASISISTLRGVLYSQLKGTFLHDAILPVVDPKRVVQASLGQTGE